VSNISRRSIVTVVIVVVIGAILTEDDECDQARDREKQGADGEYEVWFSACR